LGFGLPQTLAGFFVVGILFDCLLKQFNLEADTRQHCSDIGKLSLANHETNIHLRHERAAPESPRSFLLPLNCWSRAPSTTMISAMLANRFCLVCDERLAEVSKAMRRHESIMAQGALWLRMDEVTEERRQDFRARIIASFTEAQMAWDAYRDHLKEHGLLPFSE